MSAFNGDVEVFDLQPQEWFFKTKDAEGNLQLYVLVEFNGKERDAYLNSLNKRMKGAPSGRGQMVSMTSVEGIQAELLTRCLFMVETNDEGMPVDKDGRTTEDPKNQIRETVSTKTVQGFRSGLLQKIHKKAVELCGIGDEEEEEATAKND